MVGVIVTIVGMTATGVIATTVLALRWMWAGRMRVATAM